MSMTFGRNAFFGTFPLKDGSIGWWTNYSATDPWSQKELKDTTDVIPHALQKLERTHFPAKELVQKTSLLLKVNVFDIQSLPTWHDSNRILLIGDAAHAVSPNSGQGVSLAIEDASLLALLLSRMCSDPSDIFARFETMRKPRVEKIVSGGRKQKKNKTEVGVVGEWIRNLALRVVFGFFGVERVMGWQYRYRIDWEEENLDRCVKTFKR
jgi:2-polyprenyl-6-methoxyphenol hydroxylase-like FAD-dependent oxidoreductase